MGYAYWRISPEEWQQCIAHGRAWAKTNGVGEPRHTECSDWPNGLVDRWKWRRDQLPGNWEHYVFESYGDEESCYGAIGLHFKHVAWESRTCDLCGKLMGDDVGHCHKACWDNEDFLSQATC